MNGAYGRMGQCMSRALQFAPDLSLVGQAGVEDDLADMIRQTHAQVVADFTVASCALENAQIIIEAGVHPVIGTTGLLPDDVAHLRARCEVLQLGGVIAPNFSIGAVLLMQAAAKIANYLPQAEIIEMHHMGKQDSPSGSALRTAQMIAKGRSGKTNERSVGVESVAHARGADFEQTQIHAVRLPGLIAEQQVIFGGEGETVRLVHSTQSRESFVPGVLLACRKVKHLKGLYVGLETLLDDEIKN